MSYFYNIGGEKMFLGKNKKNLRSLLTAFAVAVTALAGAGISNAQTRNRLNDFTGNGRTDWTTLAFTTGGPIRWKTTGNPANPAPNAAFKREFDYGLTDTDSIAVGDYRGDIKSDLTVWRDFGATAAGTAGVFYVSQFPTGTTGIVLDRATPFGDAFTDVPGVQGDYDGDGKDDYAVVRVSGTNLVWYILNSSNGAFRTVQFGALAGTGFTGTSVFPGADFNGDGRDELIMLYRNTAGTQVTYFVGDSLTGAGVITRTFGNYNNDYSVAPDDYTGDGRADFVAVRQTNGSLATWYVANSQNSTVTATNFGIADPLFAGDGDVPVRGDFDGDGRHDICVWRPSNSTFYYLSSMNPGVVGGQQAGASTDTPLGSFGLY